MVRISAKSYDEAVTKAVIELGTSSENIDIVVLEKGNNGFLGIFSKPWVITATKKQDYDLLYDEEFLADKAVEVKLEKEKKQPKEAEKTHKSEKKQKTEKQELKKTDKTERQEAKLQKTDKKDVKKEAVREATKEVSEKLEVKKTENKQEEKKEHSKEVAGSAKTTQKKDVARKIGFSNKKPLEDGKVNQPQPVKETTVAEDSDLGISYEPDIPETELVKREFSAEEIAHIISIAEEFLSKLLVAMNVAARLESTFSPKDRELSIYIAGDEDLGVLIGKRGQTLDALQYIVSLVLNKKTEYYVRLKLDTENYREKRKKKLEIFAKSIAAKVKKSSKPFVLEPMNPYERRIIHSCLQHDSGVSTRSDGDEPFRYITVLPKNNRKNSYNKKYHKK